MSRPAVRTFLKHQQTFCTKTGTNLKSGKDGSEYLCGWNNSQNRRGRIGRFVTGKQSCVSDVVAWYHYLIRFDRQKSQMQKVIHFFWEAQYVFSFFFVVVLS